MKLYALRTGMLLVGVAAVAGFLLSWYFVLAGYIAGGSYVFWGLAAVAASCGALVLVYKMEKELKAVRALAQERDIAPGLVRMREQESR